MSGWQHERSISRTALAEIVWGGAIAEGWERALTAIVSKLRAALVNVGIAAETLAGATGWYQMRLPAGCWIDVQSAEANPERARRLIAAGSRYRIAAVR